MMWQYSAWALGLVGGVHPKCLLSNEIKPRTGTGLVGAPWHWHWGEQSPQVETEPGKIYSLEKNHSVTFRLPPEHTIDPTALFLSSCPVKCNDPEVTVLNFHFHENAFPHSDEPKLSGVSETRQQCVCVCWRLQRLSASSSGSCQGTQWCPTSFGLYQTRTVLISTFATDGHWRCPS